MVILKKALTESTWAQLKEAAQNGELYRLLDKGDQIPITLKNGEDVSLTVGQDEHGKVYFCFEDCIFDEYPMNRRNTNEGGWAATDMRRRLNTSLFALLPDDLQAVIEPTKIVQIIDGERVETEDKLFLFSKTQMFGKGSWSEIEPEDTQINIFKTEKSRVKECAGHGTWWYFLRTPYNGATYRFCVVGISGIAYTNTASNSIGVAPGFCIT